MCYGRPVTPVSGMRVPQSDFNWSQAENCVNNRSVRYYVLAIHFNTAFSYSWKISSLSVFYSEGDGSFE